MRSFLLQIISFTNIWEVSLRVLKFIACTAIIFFGCDKSLNDSTRSDPQSGPFQIDVLDTRGYDFLLFLPENDKEMIDGKYPTIIFLHGIGDGKDMTHLRKYAFPRNLEGDKNFPFIFITPRCADSTEWYFDNVDNVLYFNEMLDDAIARYPIDTNRIYLTGLSMGGIGTWYFAYHTPQRFAAIGPIAFKEQPGWDLCKAKSVPAWGFHGALDKIIPLSAAQQLVQNFRMCGGNINFTVYPQNGHDAWTITYNKPDLYDWFLKQRKNYYRSSSVGY